MNLNQPLVTVVIPTYNHAHLLKRALESVVAQTFREWEAIVVNNFSTDATAEVVKAFNDSRIRLVDFNNSGIIAASRNQGIKLAMGKFIAFLDSDDKWYDTKLQRCVEQTQHGYQFISHGELWIESDLSKRKVMYGPEKNANYARLLFRGNCISTSAVFVGAELIRSVKGFDESAEIVTAEDYELWLRLASTSPKTIFIQEILGEFHRTKNSASSAVLRNLDSEKVVLKKHFALQNKNVFTKLRMRHRLAIANYGAARQFSDQISQALTLFWQAFKLSPLVIKIYPAIGLLLIKSIFSRKSI